MSQAGKRGGQSRRSQRLNVDDLGDAGSDDDQYLTPKVKVHGKNITITGVARRKDANQNPSRDLSDKPSQGSVSSATRHHPYSAPAATDGVNIRQAEVSRRNAEQAVTLSKAKQVQIIFPKIELSVLEMLCDSLGSVDSTINYLLEETANPSSAFFIPPEYDSGDQAESDLSISERTSPFELTLLPDECQLRICDFLSLSEMRVVARVSKFMHNLAQRYFGRVQRLDLSRHRNWTPKLVVSTIKLFPALTQLSLRRCAPLGPSLLDVIMATPQGAITQLNLEGVRLRKNVARLIATRLGSSLETLILDGTDAGDSVMEALCQPFMFADDDRGNNHVSDEEGVDDYRLVDETNMGSLSPISASGFTATFPKLRSLSLANCPLSTYGLSFVSPEAFPRLRELNLRGCERLQDIAVPPLLGLPELETLNLSHCPKLQKLSIHATSTRGLSLRQISLAGCSSLVSLSVLVPWLVDLTVNDARILRKLELGCPALGYLSLNGCSKLSSLTFKCVTATVSQTAAIASSHLPSLLKQISLSTRKTTPVSESDTKSQAAATTGFTPKEPRRTRPASMKPSPDLRPVSASEDDEAWFDAQLRLGIEQSKRSFQAELVSPEGGGDPNRPGKVRFSWGPKVDTTRVSLTDAAQQASTLTSTQGETSVLSPNYTKPEFPALGDSTKPKAVDILDKPVPGLDFPDLAGEIPDDDASLALALTLADYEEVKSLPESKITQAKSTLQPHGFETRGLTHPQSRTPHDHSTLDQTAKPRHFTEDLTLSAPVDVEAAPENMQDDIEHLIPLPVIVRKRGMSRTNSRRSSKTNTPVTTPQAKLPTNHPDTVSLVDAESTTTSPTLTSANWITALESEMKVNARPQRDVMSDANFTGHESAIFDRTAAEEQQPTTVLSLLNQGKPTPSRVTAPQSPSSPTSSIRTSPPLQSTQEVEPTPMTSAMASPVGLRLSQTFESLIGGQPGSLATASTNLTNSAGTTGGPARQLRGGFEASDFANDSTMAMLRTTVRNAGALLNVGVQSLFEPGTISYAPSALWSLNITQCHILPQRPVIEMLLASSATLSRFHAAGAYQLTDKALEVLLMPPLSVGLIAVDVGGCRYMTEHMLMKLDTMVSTNIEVAKQLIDRGYPVHPGLASIFQKSSLTGPRLHGSPRVSANVPPRQPSFAPLGSQGQSDSPSMSPAPYPPRSAPGSPSLVPGGTSSGNLGSFSLTNTTTQTTAPFSFTRMPTGVAPSPPLQPRPTPQSRQPQVPSTELTNMYPILSSSVFSFGKLYAPRQSLPNIGTKRIEDSELGGSLALLATKAAAVVAGVDQGLLSTLISVAESDQRAGATSIGTIPTETEYLTSFSDHGPRSFKALLIPSQLPAQLLGMGAVQDTSLPALRRLAAAADQRAFANTGLASDAFESLGAQAQREHQEHLLLRRALQFLAGAGMGNTSPQLSALSGFEQFSILPGAGSSPLLVPAGSPVLTASSCASPTFLPDTPGFAPVSLSTASNASMLTSTTTFSTSTPPLSPAPTMSRFPPGSSRAFNLPPPPTLRSSQLQSTTNDGNSNAAAAAMLRQQRLNALRPRLREEIDITDQDEDETTSQFTETPLATDDGSVELDKNLDAFQPKPTTPSSHARKDDVSVDDLSTLAGSPQTLVREFNNSPNETGRSGFIKSMSYDALLHTRKSPK